MSARACSHSNPPCRSCINKRNRIRGHETQRRAFAILEIPVKYRGQRANEEAWGESPHLPGVRWEIKKGKQIPVFLRDAIAQVTAARAGVGNLYYPAVAIELEDSTEPFAVVRLDDLVNLAKAWREVGMGHAIKSKAKQIKRLADEIEGAA